MMPSALVNVRRDCRWQLDGAAAVDGACFWCGGLRGSGSQLAGRPGEHPPGAAQPAPAGDWWQLPNGGGLLLLASRSEGTPKPKFSRRLDASQATEMSMGLLQEVLVLSAGKGGEEESAVAALASLRQALVGRLVKLLGNLDTLLNTPVLLESFCKLHWSVLEVGGLDGGISLSPTCSRAAVQGGLAYRVNIS